VVEPESIPQVISIYGSGKKLYALLHYPSGLRIDVRPSETIDGEYTVKSITPSRVVLSRGDKEYVLRTYPGVIKAAANNKQNNSAVNNTNPMPIGSMPPSGMQFYPSR